MTVAASTRNYIKRITLDCEPDYDEINFSFDPETQIPETIQECSYHIKFVDISNVNEDASCVEDDVSIEVSFLKAGYQDEITEHQDFIDKIYCLRNNILNFKNYDTGIIKISPIGFTIEPLDTDNNIMIIKLQLAIKFGFSFN